MCGTRPPSTAATVHACGAGPCRHCTPPCACRSVRVACALVRTSAQASARTGCRPLLLLPRTASRVHIQPVPRTVEARAASRPNARSEGGCRSPWARFYVALSFGCVRAHWCAFMQSMTRRVCRYFTAATPLLVLGSGVLDGIATVCSSLLCRPFFSSSLVFLILSGLCSLFASLLVRCSYSCSDVRACGTCAAAATYVAGARGRGRRLSGQLLAHHMVGLAVPVVTLVRVRARA